MFAQKMLVEQDLIHANFRIQHHASEGHFCHLFHDYGIVNRLVSILSPGEWAMIVNQHSRNLIRIQRFKPLDDNLSGFQFIFPLNFFFCHFPGTWNLTIKVIGMSCTNCRNTFARLRPARCPFGMSMNHPTNIKELAVQFNMSWRIARWLQLAFDDHAIQIKNNHVGWLHCLIRNTTGFNHYQTILAVDCTNVSPGKNNQSVSHQIQIGLPYFFF